MILVLEDLHLRLTYHYVKKKWFSDVNTFCCHRLKSTCFGGNLWPTLTFLDTNRRALMRVTRYTVHISSWFRLISFPHSFKWVGTKFYSWSFWGHNYFKVLPSQLFELPSIAVCCFYFASRAQETSVFVVPYRYRLFNNVANSKEKSWQFDNHVMWP